MADCPHGLPLYAHCVECVGEQRVGERPASVAEKKLEARLLEIQTQKAADKGAEIDRLRSEAAAVTLRCAQAEAALSAANAEVERLRNLFGSTVRALEAALDRGHAANAECDRLRYRNAFLEATYRELRTQREEAIAARGAAEKQVAALSAFVESVVAAGTLCPAALVSHARALSKSLPASAKRVADVVQTALRYGRLQIKSKNFEVVDLAELKAAETDFHSAVAAYVSSKEGE